MHNDLKPILKTSLLFIGASFGINFIVVYFFGFIAAFIVNTVFFVGIMFYIRIKRLGAQRPLGRSYYGNEGIRLRYMCLSCEAEMKGLKCSKCGSKMKKPLF
jgi:hypothetical protein